MQVLHSPTRSRRLRALSLIAITSTLGMLASACVDQVDWTKRGDDQNQGGESVSANSGHYNATIRRSEGQVAHIEAADLEGVVFGQGWASAEDRACDLADQVLKVNGERSRYFGAGDKDANLNSDFAWKTIGIRDIAAKDWKDADKGVTSLFTAYTAGWNAQIRKVGVDKINDWCAGEPWVRELKPLDVYTYARSVALLASSGAVIDMIGVAQPPAVAEPPAGNTSSGTDTSSGTSDSASDGTPTTESSNTPTTTGGEQAMPDLGASEHPLASNAWAVGPDRTESGDAMLLANPHFPWEGELRFWEVHLTVPGKINMYGVQLSGIPGIGIGFNEHFGWSHTVSAGSRMTAYSLDLQDGAPTKYKYGSETREMTSQDLTIKVLGADGNLTDATRTTWRSHYGPILDFPGVGWSKDMAITFRDANINNDEFISQYIETLKANDLDDLIELNRRYTGVPLFNTIAASDDGRVWYADTSATPNLSKEAQDAYTKSLDTNFLAKAAADSGAILLDGSDPLFEWQNVDGARDPGLVPFDEMPVVERSDYVFNANDSFWMPNATHMIEGSYSILHGPQRTARSPRTRENATVLESNGTDGPAGSDRNFSFDELKAAALLNRGFTSRALKDSVVKRCRDAGPVELGAIEPEQKKDGSTVDGLPAATIDTSDACQVLADWDGTYDLDSRGAILWREFIARYPGEDLDKAGSLWADPFDFNEPVATPTGLAAADSESPDPVLENLARAVQVIEKAGLNIDSALGDAQFAYRNGIKVPVHGGTGSDGTTNIATWSKSSKSMDPWVRALKARSDSVQSDLLRATFNDPSGEAVEMVGYPVIFGTSFLMALDFTDNGPRADTFLTYGNTADRASDSYLDVTKRFSNKDWKKALFTDADVRRGALSTERVRD